MTFWEWAVDIIVVGVALWLVFVALFLAHVAIRGSLRRKRRLRVIRRAAKDEQRIIRRETDFATYTESLIDLHARRAREASQKR